MLGRVAGTGLDGCSHAVGRTASCASEVRARRDLLVRPDGTHDSLERNGDSFTRRQPGMMERKLLHNNTILSRAAPVVQVMGIAEGASTASEAKAKEGSRAPVDDERTLMKNGVT